MFNDESADQVLREILADYKAQLKAKLDEEKNEKEKAITVNSLEDPLILREMFEYTIAQRIAERAHDVIVKHLLAAAFDIEQANHADIRAMYLFNAYLLARLATDIALALQSWNHSLTYERMAARFMADSKKPFKPPRNRKKNIKNL